MLKYTRAAVSRIVIDIRLLAHIANVVMQSLMIAYLVFSILTERGSLLINAILSALTAANLVFYLITYRRSGREAKRLRKRVSRTYVAAKLMVNIVPLASIGYSVYVGAQDVTSLALVLTPLMIILWILQVVFNLSRVYIENRAALFMDGIEMDMEFIKKPLAGVKNRIHDFFGEEREDERPISDKNRIMLEKHAEKREAERGARRARRRAILRERISSWFGSKNLEPTDGADKEHSDEKETAAKS